MLAGVAYFICIELGIRHGMTFSHGLIDFVVLFTARRTRLWFLVLGPLWALMYYGVVPLRDPPLRPEDARP